MRTKTALLTAAALAAGVVASMAQNVYSVNVVGYVNKVIAPGFQMIANPLNAGTNTLANVIPNPPNGANFLRWNGSSFDTYTFFFGAWDNPDATLAPGEGGFINTDTQFTNTFVGEVMQGSLSNAIPAGFSIVSSQVPQSGNVDDLGLTDDLANGANLLKWTGNGYDTYTLFFGSWDPSTPTIDVGESVFINTDTATAWTRSFSVQ
jgi:hypothetical protein